MRPTNSGYPYLNRSSGWTCSSQLAGPLLVAPRRPEAHALCRRRAIRRRCRRTRRHDDRCCGVDAEFGGGACVPPGAHVGTVPFQILSRACWTPSPETPVIEFSACGDLVDLVDVDDAALGGLAHLGRLVDASRISRRLTPTLTGTRTVSASTIVKTAPVNWPPGLASSVLPVPVGPMSRC